MMIFRKPHISFLYFPLNSIGGKGSGNIIVGKGLTFPVESYISQKVSGTITLDRKYWGWATSTNAMYITPGQTTTVWTVPYLDDEPPFNEESSEFSLSDMVGGLISYFPNSLSVYFTHNYIIFFTCVFFVDYLYYTSPNFIIPEIVIKNNGVPVMSSELMGFPDQITTNPYYFFTLSHISIDADYISQNSQNLTVSFQIKNNSSYTSVYLKMVVIMAMPEYIRLRDGVNKTFNVTLVEKNNEPFPDWGNLEDVGGTPFYVELVDEGGSVTVDESSYSTPNVNDYYESFSSGDYLIRFPSPSYLYEEIATRKITTSTPPSINELVLKNISDYPTKIRVSEV